MDDIIDSIVERIVWRGGVLCECPGREELREIIASGFKLKPLVWEENPPEYGKLVDRWICYTVFGRYAVTSQHDGVVYRVFGQTQPCDSIEHGKELCERDYRDRVAGLFEG